MEQPPHESRDTASVALEFPTPLVVLNSTIRQALSFLFSACDTVQTGQDGARHLLHLHRFQDVDQGGRGMNRPSDVEKLSSDKRLA